MAKRKPNRMADRGHLPPSLWAATAGNRLELDRLDGDQRFDIVIVGAGYTGLSAALSAVRRGARVAVLDAGEPGWGASGRNGGQVIAGLKIDPDELAERFGRARAERLADAAGRAPDFVFDLINRHSISCGAKQNGFMQPAFGERGHALIEARVAQWQRLGAGVMLAGKTETEALTGTRIYEAALVDDRGGSLHPLDYARGLAAAVRRQGGVIAGRSPVLDISGRAGAWCAHLQNGKVTADKIIIATNAYTGGLYDRLGASVMPVASFIVATRVLDADIQRTILPQGHVAADTRKFLCYFRLDDEGRLVYGARGKMRDPRRPGDFAHVIAEMRQWFPQIGDVPVEFMWSGRVAVSADNLPHFHEPEPGLLAMVGYSGRGIAAATLFGAQAGEYAVSGDEAVLDLPVMPVEALPFAWLRPMIVAAAGRWSRYVDGRPKINR